jgi:hypothetical protein
MTDQELIRAYASGTTDLDRAKIVMQSENFIVFKVPGHTDWAGVGMRDYYATHTVLIRKGEWCLNGDRREWYGRISKKVLKEALDKAQQTGKVEVAVFGDLYKGMNP